MLEWISQHQKILSVLISFGTLLVWIIYAQLLYNGYRRQRRPHVLINRGRHRDVHALCLISNMSAEAIFVQHIVVHLDTDRGVLSGDVTELERSYQEGGEERHRSSGFSSLPLSAGTRQGPLGPGEVEHMGSFRDVIERVARAHGVVFEQCAADQGREGEPAQLRGITLEILAVYGSDNLPIGVTRRFTVTDDRLIPDSWDSKKVTSRLRRRRLRGRIEEIARGRLSAPDY